MKNKNEVDVVIVGAGFSGMYMLHLLRQEGLSVRLFESGSDVGGTWYWNRYPGARCDVPVEFYCYTFSEEIHRDWSWSSYYPEQDEILKYLQYVADKLDLRKDIVFDTHITDAQYDEENHKWSIDVGEAEPIVAKYFIPAIGNVSVEHKPDIKGLDQFKGEMYHTSKWPHEGVDLKGKKVGVIGTGSSGVQTITAVAKEAESLTVFQRTAQYVLPVKNFTINQSEEERMKKEFSELRKNVRDHMIGMPVFQIKKMYSALDDSPEEREALYEKLWNEANGFQSLYSYMDITLDDDANKTYADFVRKKIKEIVKDEETAENLFPNYLIGGKRPIVATGYYETYNRDNVSLVNLRKTPIVKSTENELHTTDSVHELDVIIFASGFDAMTGPLMNTNIKGRNSITLKEKWEGGRNLKTYLGICNIDFPNMFTITGPHFPLTTNAFSVNELIAEWIIDCIKYAEERDIEEIEVTQEAENLWTDHVNEVGEASIYAKVDSWYTGANIEGKPRAFYGYTGDFLTFQQMYENSRDYKGLKLKQAKNLHQS